MRWQIQEAKARFSELVRAAHADGAQFVTKHGRDEVVILSIDEYQQLIGAPSFKEPLRQPPFVDDLPDTSDLRRELPRESELGLD